MEQLGLPALEETVRRCVASGGETSHPSGSGGIAGETSDPSNTADPSATAVPARAAPVPERRWCLETLAGRISELVSAGAVLTPAARILLEAQERGEPAAWIATGASTFFPPDLDAFGVDLAALPVIRVPGALAGARAAEHLLRSGSLGVVVLDLCDAGTGVVCSRRPAGSPAGPTMRRPYTVRPSNPRRPLFEAAVLTRLAALCRKHRATLLCLTRPRGPMGDDGAGRLGGGNAATSPGDGVLGSFVSLRVQGTIRRTGFDRFTWELQILKDKVQGPGWSHAEVCRGPDGLC